MATFRLILAACIALLLSASAWAQNEILLSGDPIEYSPRPGDVQYFVEDVSFEAALWKEKAAHLQYKRTRTPEEKANVIQAFYEQLYKKHKSLQIEDILAAKKSLFASAATSIPNMGLTNNPVWYKVKLKFHGQRSTKYIVSADGFFRHVDVFITDKDRVISRLRTGSFYPPGARPIFDWGTEYAIPVEMAPQQSELTIYFKTHTSGTVSALKFLLYTEKEYIHSRRIWYICQALYFGLAIGLIFYHAILFMFSRQLSHLLYSIFLLCYLNLFVNLTQFGIAFHEYVGGIYVAEYWIFSAFAAWLALFFYFKESVETRDTAKKTSLVINIMIGFAIILWFGHFYQSQLLYHQITLIWTIIASFVLMIITASMAVRGNRNATIFLAIFSMTLVCLVITTLLNSGWLTRNFLTENAMQIGSVGDMILLSVALGDKLRALTKEKYLEAKKKTHAYHQLEKVFYPHQIYKIGLGYELEDTMPTGPGEACVISFDIVGSSKIQHVKIKDFYRNVFRRCYDIMMEGYDVKDLKANAYRIKEMGDGFLCSVGYPFKSTHESIAIAALELSLRFFEVFQDEVKKLDYSEPIHCGIGIAVDSIAGFYPESGAKEYDLFGRAIILATRYEGMRKVILQDEGPSSLLILQERVFKSLDTMNRERFQEFDLKLHNSTVRDDPGAAKIYYLSLFENDRTSQLYKAS